MKEKTELLTNFNFFSILIEKMLQKEIQSLCNFSFLKLLKLSPQTRFKVFYRKDAFSAHKTSLFISFTSLIGTE
jgi:hypothetical protein